MIDAAHDLYGDYSIYEVMDLDRPAAIAKMMEMYGGSVDLGKMEKYFTIIDRIREWREQLHPGRPVGNSVGKVDTHQKRPPSNSSQEGGVLCSRLYQVSSHSQPRHH